MPYEFDDAKTLTAAAGQKLGHTPWLEVTQQRIDQFAEATDDHQWIHVDPERAKSGPFGAPIAHGYLTLSLISYFLSQLITVPRAKMGIRCGCRKVRFPSPVLVGSRIRGSGEILEATDTPDGVELVVRVSVEIEGAEKPACTAETVSRFVF